MQHNENSTLHTLTPSGELIKGLVKAVKVALNEKYGFFPRKIGALMSTLDECVHPSASWKPLNPDHTVHTGTAAATSQPCLCSTVRFRTSIAHKHKTQAGSHLPTPSKLRTR